MATGSRNHLLQAAAPVLTSPLSSPCYPACTFNAITAAHGTSRAPLPTHPPVWAGRDSLQHLHWSTGLLPKVLPGPDVSLEPRRKRREHGLSSLPLSQRAPSTPAVSTSHQEHWMAQPGTAWGKDSTNHTPGTVRKCRWAFTGCSCPHPDVFAQPSSAARHQQQTLDAITSTSQALRQL